MNAQPQPVAGELYEGEMVGRQFVIAGGDTATLCNLANLSYMLGRKLRWDGINERIVADEHANRLLDQPQRHPYHL